ncbi:MAG: hypothetical protein HYS17_11785 [Micavibrio aeruginosavorus]|uniref:Uncharacterized protein n=1 Tax=Micavibrio aeruginosavorus TaxID=349221 RepID=A0A7T5UGQ5_9BACT|nr:MAG: hypothetical protein HYS17_11785 [Micavibrio aeruginosavorus]
MAFDIKAIEGFLAAGDLASASVALNELYGQWDRLSLEEQAAIQAIEPVYLSLLGMHKGEVA